MMKDEEDLSDVDDEDEDEDDLDDDEEDLDDLADEDLDEIDDLDDFDDEVLRTRIKVYEETTQHILKHYPASKISRFNADQRPLEVLRDVLASLSDLLSHPENPT